MDRVPTWRSGSAPCHQAADNVVVNYWTGPAERVPLSVAEMGSFHVGGRMTRIEGLPLRERISAQGGPVHVVDPNGEIIVGQAYVHTSGWPSPRLRDRS